MIIYQVFKRQDLGIRIVYSAIWSKFIIKSGLRS